VLKVGGWLTRLASVLAVAGGVGLVAAFNRLNIARIMIGWTSVDYGDDFTNHATVLFDTLRGAIELLGLSVAAFAVAVLLLGLSAYLKRRASGTKVAGGGERVVSGQQ